MKIEIEKQHLPFFKSATNILSRDTTIRPETTLWLDCIDRNTVRITTNNGSVEYTHCIPAKVTNRTEEGVVGFNGYMLRKLLSQISSNITIETKATGTILNHKNGKIKLQTSSLNYFIDNEKEPEDPKKRYSVKNFKKYIQSIQHCTVLDGNSDASFLRCLFLSNAETSDGPRVSMCALNGHQFARQLFFVDQNIGRINCGEDGILIDKNHFSTITNFTDNNECLFLFSDTRVFFKNRMEELLSVPRVIDIKYPDYTKFLNKFTDSSVKTAKINRQNFQDSLERGRIISDKKSDQDVHLTFNDNKLSFFIEDGDAGVNSGASTSEEMEVEFSGNEKFEILFRINSLYDVVNHFNDIEIYLSFTNSIGPCKVYGADESYIAIIMPVEEITGITNEQDNAETESAQ